MLFLGNSRPHNRRKKLRIGWSSTDCWLRKTRRFATQETSARFGDSKRLTERGAITGLQASPWTARGRLCASSPHSGLQFTE